MKKTIAAVLIVSMVGILNSRTVVFAEEADVPSEPVQPAETGSTGWGEEDGHKVYLDKNGNKLTGIVTIEGSSYCFDSNGYMQTGLIDAGGKQYYFDDAGKMILNKTLQINGSWYRIGEDGSAVLDSADIDIIETDKGKILLLKGTQYFGWYQMPDGSWTYWDQADNGIQSISKWLLIDNNWYYFDENGKRVEGFYVAPDGSHYLFVNGIKQMDGWKFYQNCWYYIDGDRAVVSSWKLINGSWYYFDQNGIAVHDWYQINGRWYQFEDGGSCRMKTGWSFSNGHWYWLDTNIGRLENSWKYDGGRWFYLDADGIACEGWHFINGAWYGFEGGGSCRMITGWTYSDGIWYYLDPSGAMVSGDWRYINGHWYYFEAGGAMKTGWLKYSYCWYYLDGNGSMLAGTTRWIGDRYYKFTGSGIMYSSDTYSYLGVPNYNQYAIGAPVGCEGVSLYQALQYRGKVNGISLHDFLNNLPRAGSPYDGFVGTPFADTNNYSAIFPAPLARYGSGYADVEDISGSSVEQLYAEIAQGHPVVAYVTIGYTNPVWRRYYFGWGLTNNHAVTLDGYDYTTGQVHVSDPISGSIWISMYKFTSIYNARKFAVVVK